MKLTKINFEKQNERNQAQTETYNDPGNAVSELQQFHKPTSRLITVSSVSYQYRISTVSCFDENELSSDYRYQHYLQNITRIENKQEVLQGNIIRILEQYLNTKSSFESNQ